MQPLALASSANASSAKVNPLVLFNICDSYIRRNEGAERVIGTLMGNIIDGVASITNCYTVPHNESLDQVHFARPFLQSDVSQSSRFLQFAPCAHVWLKREWLIQVAVDIVHHKTLFDLHQKVSKKDVVIGWLVVHVLSLPAADTAIHRVSVRSPWSTNFVLSAPGSPPATP